MSESKNGIDYGKLQIKDIFQKWYRIPNYQRPYVWESEQVLALLEDITTAMQDTRMEYFLGSLVLKSTKVNDKDVPFTSYDLLDGQQRLTTLFLLMAVISSLTEDEQVKNITKNALRTAKNEYADIPERIRIVFDIRGNVSEFIKKYIIEKDIKDNLSFFKETAETKTKNIDISIKNISNTVVTCHEYFVYNNINVNDFFKFLNLNVSLIYVGSNDFDDAFRLFTVMNSRGIALRSSDILKAKNLSAIDESERKIYAEKWEEIENYFDDEFDNFLSYLRTILVKQRAKNSLLKEYEDVVYSKGILELGKNTIDKMEKYKDIYNEIFNKNHFEKFKGFELDNYLKMMKKGYEADYWVVAILEYFRKFKETHFLEFVKRLDNRFSYDWIIGTYATRRIDNINDILKHIDNASTPEELFKTELLNLSEKNVSDFKNIIENDIYGRRYARYLLIKLEFLLTADTMELKDTPIMSIEHVLPQNPKSDSEWVKLYTSEERETLTNKLGNLILLSKKKNSSQGNMDFEKKRTNYYDKNIEPFSLTVKIMNNDNWSKDTLEVNQTDSIRSLIDTYLKYISS